MVAETPPLVTLNLRMPSNADRFDLKHFTVRSSAVEQPAVNFTLTEGSAHVIFPMRDLNLNETLTVTAVSMCLQEGEPSLPSSVSNKLILSERGEMQTSVYTINNYSSYLFLQLPLFLPVLICLISVVSSYNIYTLVHLSTFMVLFLLLKDP